MNDTTLAFGVAILTASLSAYPIYRLLLHLNARQTVSIHVAEHAHKQGTPTMGGLIIAVGFLAACLALFNRIPEAGAFAVVFLGFALIGFVDDYVVPRAMRGKRGLGWPQKLGAQLVVAIMGTMALGWRKPEEVGIAVFLMLFFSNAYNFADGMDWLAGTLWYGMALALAGVASIFGLIDLLPLIVALSAALLPFMVLNRPKAKVFMGDVGALPIGAVLGLLVTMLGFQGAYVAPLPSFLALLCLSIVMIIELVPVPLQILSVKLRKGKRLFPMTPIHHAFQKAGWPEGRVVLLFATTQLVGSILCVLLARSVQ